LTCPGCLFSLRYLEPTEPTHDDYTTGGALALPDSIEVTYWDGTSRGWAPTANV
jgi:hypothetical protein